MSPAAPLRPCLGARSGCRNLVKAGRCLECQRTYEQARRPAWIKKFYTSKQWQDVRNMKARQHPVCEDCLDAFTHAGAGAITPVQVVDHVLPLATHPHLRVSMDNLRSLCHMHHSIKTKAGR